MSGFIVNYAKFENFSSLFSSGLDALNSLDTGSITSFPEGFEFTSEVNSAVAAINSAKTELSGLTSKIDETRRSIQNMSNNVFYRITPSLTNNSFKDFFSNLFKVPTIEEPDDNKGKNDNGLLGFSTLIGSGVAILNEKSRSLVETINNSFFQNNNSISLEEMSKKLTGALPVINTSLTSNDTNNDLYTKIMSFNNKQASEDVLADTGTVEKNRINTAMRDLIINNLNNTLNKSISFNTGFKGGYGNMDISRLLDNGSPIEVPYYAQGSGESWANIPYGDNDIAHDGCSITSMAMAFSYLLKDNITPDKLINKIEEVFNERNYGFVNGTGLGWGAPSEIGNVFDDKEEGINITFEEIGGKNYDGIKESLKNGNTVIVSNPSLTNCPHYFIVTGYDEKTGRIYVNDPANVNRSTDEALKFDEVMSHNNRAWACSLEKSEPIEPERQVPIKDFVK